MTRRPSQASVVQLLIAGLPFILNGCAEERGEPPDALAHIVFEEVARVDGYEHDLVSINSSALSSDAVIAIGQTLVGTVLLVDRSGEVLGSVGSSGEGPGEFRVVGPMGWWGTDTLWVYDPWQRRLTSFSIETLKHLGVESMNPLMPTSGEGWVRREPLGLSPGHGLLFRGVPGGPSSSAEAIGVSEPGASAPRILFTFPRVDEDVMFGDSSIRVGFGIPWTLRSLVDVSPDGRRVASLVMSEGEGGTIHTTTTLLSLDGDTLFSTPARFDAVPITASEADSALGAALERMPQSTRHRFGIDLDAVSLPSMKPAFSTIVVGVEGSVWQRVRSLASYDAGAYLWLDPGGTMRGVGHLPAGRILEADDEIVWVEETDSVGVPSLVAYRYSLDPA